MISLTIDGFQGPTRGTTIPGRNSDIVLAEAFPEAGHFIEKPISSHEDFAELDKVGNAFKGKITSVGYMLRYLRGMSRLLPAAIIDPDISC